MGGQLRGEWVSAGFATAFPDFQSMQNPIRWLLAVTCIASVSCRSPSMTDIYVVKYKLDNNKFEVIEVQPRISNRECREMFIRNYVDGFNQGLEGKLVSLISWEATNLGRCGEKGYVTGYLDGIRHFDDQRKGD